MNNKKIIFGILLFCAISFIAYTFANPLEKEDDEGKLVPGSNQIQNTGNDKDNNNDDDDQIDAPIKVDDPTDEDDPNGAVVVNPSDTTQPGNTNTTTRPTNPSRPSGSAGNNNGGGNSSSGNNTPVVDVTDVTIGTPNNTKLALGNTVNLGVSVSPSNATNKNVTYTSSNQNVIKVDSNGNVTAVGSGTATITVTTSNGINKTITITVLGNVVSKITAISTRPDNTTITSAAQGNTSLALKGSVTKGTNHAVDVRIYVPKEYNTDLLKNLKYNIMINEYGMGVHDNTYIGINRIIGDISTGDAYVVFPLEFDDDVVEGRDGSLKIAVDWLGCGSPIIYSIDFSGISIN